MAELATIARPYAEALYKACGSELAATAEWLDELAAIAANPQLQQYAADPKVTDQQTLDVFAGVVKVALVARRLRPGLLHDQTVSLLCMFLAHRLPNPIERPI